jgi:cytochrome bd-type quinol oxidase subunit 2
MTRRVLLTLALAGAAIESAWLLLGPPDVIGAMAFFTDRFPALDTERALMVTLAWLLIAAVVGIAITAVFRAIGRSQRRRQTSIGASVLLTAGMLILVVSVVHRSLPSPTACCGSGAAEIREAIQLAH